MLCKQPSDWPCIPVSCEVDIYGALSEFIGTCISQDAVTLLDINNSVPEDLYNEDIKGKFNYDLKETFMGFHCGNTNSKKLAFCEMKYQSSCTFSAGRSYTGNSGRRYHAW